MARASTVKSREETPLPYTTTEPATRRDASVKLLSDSEGCPSKVRDSDPPSVHVCPRGCFFAPTLCEAQHPHPPHTSELRTQTSTTTTTCAIRKTDRPQLHRRSSNP